MNDYTMHRVYNRPDTTSYENLDALILAMQLEDEATKIEHTDLKWAQIKPGTESIALLSDDLEAEYDMTNWSANQLATKIGVPMQFVKKLSPDTQDRVWNERLSDWIDENKEQGDRLVTLTTVKNEVRGINGPKFGHVSHLQPLASLKKFVDWSGWKPFPTNDGRMSIFSTDRSLHVFMGTGGSRLIDDGSPKGIQMGFIFQTSNVGAGCEEITVIAFREVCGNLIIWDALFKITMKCRHTKNVQDRRWKLTEMYDHIDSFDYGKIQASFDNARKLFLPAGEDKVVDWMRRFRGAKFSDAEIKAAYKMAEKEEGQVSTVYDLYNGATALARNSKHPDTQIDTTRKWSILLSEAVAA
jgi:hypothetical protein